MGSSGDRVDLAISCFEDSLFLGVDGFTVDLRFCVSSYFELRGFVLIVTINENVGLCAF